MTQIATHFEERITQNTTTAQEAINAGNLGRAENANAFVQPFEVRELLASYSVRRFKDLPCPICRRFGCGGC